LRWRFATAALSCGSPPRPAVHAGRGRRGAARRVRHPTFAIKGEDNETYFRHLNAAAEHGPHLTMDDGADLVALLHTSGATCWPA